MGKKQKCIVGVPKVRQKRIVGVPTGKLETLIPMAQKIFDAVHLEGCSRATIANVFGLSPTSGSFNTKLGAMVSFGLLDTVRGSYCVTKEAERYFLPTEDKSQEMSLVYFALHPDLYLELHDRYRGKPLPTSLHNLIAQEKAIPVGKARIYVEAIRSTFEFAGLLKNGIVQSASVGTAGNQMAVAEERNLITSSDSLSHPQPTIPVSDHATAKDVKRATLPLDGTDGVVIIEWPTEITKDDFGDIVDWVEILKRKIERSVAQE